jgi:hypothetical protein
VIRINKNVLCKSVTLSANECRAKQ